METMASRRDLLLASLLAAAPLGLSGAAASPLNPAQTIIKPPDSLTWKPNPAFPEPTVDMCPLAGDVNAPGLYYTLKRLADAYPDPKTGENTAISAAFEIVRSFSNAL